MRKALTYLIRSVNIDAAVGDLKGGDLGHGGIYQHGMAAAALCEALAIDRVIMKRMQKSKNLTLVDSSGLEIKWKDLNELSKMLEQACRLAVNYIVYHQDPQQGGWAYDPKQAGDTSIMGWQAMALVSARSAQIPAPRACWAGIHNYLNECAIQGGAQYPYRKGGEVKSPTSAIGLLCRLYSGNWDKRTPALRRGIALLSEIGPSRNDMYYNYYATQVMFAYGDSAEKKTWTEWNNRMRDQLVSMQARKDHQRGSWSNGNPQGGRHMATCLAAMTLEIYYRKLPAYQRLQIAPAKLD